LVTVRPLPNPGRSKPPRVENFADFNGGLNTTANRFDLQPNETPDCYNVDIDRRGGIIRRAAATTLNDAASALYLDITPSRPFVRAAGTSGETLYVGLYRFSSLSDTGTSFSLTGGGAIAAALGAKWFLHGADPLANGTAGTSSGVCYSLDAAGTKSAAFTHSGTGRWQDSYASPSGTHAPPAMTIAAHNEHIFAGNLTEYTGLGVGNNYATYQNRLRWSHPGDGGSWRTNDYVDVGHINDPIVGLVSAADHLLILKRNSVYALHGYNAETFNLVMVSDQVGCSGPQAYCMSPRGVFFSDMNKGLHRYGGSGVEWLAEKVISYWPAYTPPTTTGYHAFAYGMYETVAVGYSAETDRVWVSLPDSTSRATDPPTNAFSLVFDPQTGAWTRNSIKTKAFFMWRGKFCGMFSDKTFHVENTTGVADTYLGSTQNIPGYWVSAWMMASQPVVPKRWGKPEFVITGNQTGTFTVTVYKDYDPITVEKTITISATNPLATSTDYDEVKRTQTVGTAKAVSLKFAGPTGQNVLWRLDAFVLKSRTKAVRN
jgi:hypothetical protein